MLPLVVFYFILFNFVCEGSERLTSKNIKIIQRISSSYPVGENKSDWTGKSRREIKDSLRRNCLLNNDRTDLNFCRNTRKPQQKNFPFSGRWGAVGMPFNVLYTPNRHQQLLKITPKLKGRLTEEQSSRESLKKMGDLFYLVMDDEKNFKKSVPRKYYSFIPQLFVSYGW